MAKDSAEKGLSEEAVKLFDLAKVCIITHESMWFAFIILWLGGSWCSFTRLFVCSILQNHEKALVILNKLLSQVQIIIPEYSQTDHNSCDQKKCPLRKRSSCLSGVTNAAFICMWLGT